MKKGILVLAVFLRGLDLRAMPAAQELLHASTLAGGVQLWLSGGADLTSRYEQERQQILAPYSF